MPPVNNNPRTLDITSATTLEDLNKFLDNKKDGDKVFGTQTTLMLPARGKDHAVTVTTLYLSKSVQGPDDLNHDRFHANNYARRNKTAYDVISTMLHNAVSKGTNSEKIENKDNKYFRDQMNILMTDVVDHKFNSPAFGGGGAFGADREIDPAKVQKVIKSTQNANEHTEMVKNAYEKEYRKPTLPDARSSVVPLLATTIEVKKGTGEKQAFPVLNIGEKEFTAEKVLGKGGFGTAVQYVSTDGAERKVVKFMAGYDLPADKLDQRALKKQKDNAALELHNGAEFAKDEARTLKFDDHVVMKNGTVALIGDIAENGDAFNLMKNLVKAKRKDLVSEHAQRLVTLTIARDTADGLDAIHKAGGIHGDVKPDNQMIDAEGKVKIIDMGLATAGPKASLLRNQTHAWAGAKYNAPEALAREDNYDDEYAAAKAAAKERGTQIKADIVELAGMTERGEVPKTFKNSDKFLSQAAFQLEADNYSVGAKSDMYGVGQGVYLMTTGKWVADKRVARIREDAGTTAPISKEDATKTARERKVALSSDPESHGINSGTGLPFDDHATVDGTGDAVIDPLLDGLLAGNPENRLSAEEVRNHPSMQYGATATKAAVGSKEVRALILAIASGVELDIFVAAQALETAFPELTAAPA